MADERLLSRLQFLHLQLQLSDIKLPTPDKAQLIYRALLTKVFALSDESLRTPRPDWRTRAMDMNLDLYQAGEPIILLLRFCQSVTEDFIGHVGDNSSECFTLSDLVKPNPARFRKLINKILDIHNIKEKVAVATKPLLEAFANDNKKIADKNEHIEHLERKLEQMKLGKQARNRETNRQFEIKERQKKHLSTLFERDVEINSQMELGNAECIKYDEQFVAHQDELAVLQHQNAALEFERVEDPEQLRTEVNEMRTTRDDQQRLLDSESRECADLESRGEAFKAAVRAMESAEGDMEGLHSRVHSLHGRKDALHEKQGALEDSEQRVEAKKEEIEARKKERVTFRVNHEEERKQQGERLTSLLHSISVLASEISQLRAAEGDVKRDIAEHKQKLVEIKNSKDRVWRETIESMRRQYAMVEDLQRKTQRKRDEFNKLMNTYRTGIERLRESMSGNVDDIMDQSVTSTMNFL